MKGRVPRSLQLSNGSLKLGDTTEPSLTRARGRSPFKDSTDITKDTSKNDMRIVPIAEPEMYAEVKRGRVPRDDKVLRSE
jgi:hypothetical protein